MKRSESRFFVRHFAKHILLQCERITFASQKDMFRNAIRHVLQAFFSPFEVSLCHFFEAINVNRLTVNNFENASYFAYFGADDTLLDSTRFSETFLSDLFITKKDIVPKDDGSLSAKTNTASDSLTEARKQAGTQSRASRPSRRQLRENIIIMAKKTLNR